jgi:hypothetical protein
MWLCCGSTTTSLELRRCFIPLTPTRLGYPLVEWSKLHLRRCPSRVCAHRRRKRRILDEVAHLDFIGRARASAPRTAQAALVVVDLSVRDERDLVGRQPADVAATAVHVQAVAQGHHAAGGHGAVAKVGCTGHASD